MEVLAIALTSSADASLPSITPALISNASCFLAKSFNIFAGATTSSLLNAIAFGPVKIRLISHIQQTSAARRVIEFL